MRTRFTELVGCRYPLQLAGMGWVSGPELAAAVARAGGLGMIALPRLPGPALDEVLASLDAGPVGVNVLMPFLDPEAVDVAARRAPVVEFFYGDPDPVVVERAGAHGALVAWQVGSVDEGRAAVDAGCGFVVAQGVEAGGHVRGTVPLFVLLDELLEAVDVPVVAAGAIGTPRTAAAALAAGADAVRVGTRFIAATEANAHPDYVDAILRARDGDTVLTTGFDVMWPDAPHRVLRSSLERAESLDGDVVGEVEMAGGRVPVPRLSPMAATRSATGDVAAMALYAGQGVGAVTHVQPAAEIVRELMDGAAGLLRAVADGRSPGRP